MVELLIELEFGVLVDSDLDELVVIESGSVVVEPETSVDVVPDAGTVELVVVVVVVVVGQAKPPDPS